jgi:hypothetical protein
MMPTRHPALNVRWFFVDVLPMEKLQWGLLYLTLGLIFFGVHTLFAWMNRRK